MQNHDFKQKMLGASHFVVMASTLQVIIGAAFVLECNVLYIFPSGYLSRTGLCVKPENNFQIKDPRLNYMGIAYVHPDDANPKCTESECSEDSHCDADRKCCRNYCGGMVCTPTSKD